ncbi:MAG TPA: sensor histidine kinase, partial [Amycolatopsis sp.]|nr:sensor histidine kinase [Amycolatopsis sp.]
MRVFGPLKDRATYRRWVYLVLGGAISVPYLLFASVAVPSILPFVTTLGEAGLIGGAIALAVLAATAFLPAVQVVQSSAVRELLDDPAPGAPARPATPEGKRRAAAMFAL